MQQAEPSGAPPLTPFHQLELKIRRTQYKLTPEEKLLLTNCNREAWAALGRGCFLGAALAWGFTRRPRASTSNLVTRLIFCFGSGLSLAMWNVSRVEARCEERLAFLEGSPLQGELIAILQRDYPDNQLLKKYLQQRSMNELAYGSTVYDSDGSIVLKRLPASQDSGPLEQEALQDEHGISGSRSHAEPQAAASPTTPKVLSTSTGRRSQEKQERQERQNSDSTLVNFFESSPWNNVEDSNNSEASKLKDTLKERRRSRMTPEERRKYNRQQYLERQHERVSEREAF